MEVPRTRPTGPTRPVAGVGATLVDENPAVGPESGDGPLDRKDTGRVSLSGLARAALDTRAGRWANRELLYQSAEMLFLRYDEPRMRPVPGSLGLICSALILLPLFPRHAL